jgi:hypothetical protein
MRMKTIIKILIYPILSLSGIPIFIGSIPAKIALNPKMPKEPLCPSRSDTWNERQYVRNETNRLENKSGQRTTHRGIAEKPHEKAR